MKRSKLHTPEASKEIVRSPASSKAKKPPLVWLKRPTATKAHLFRWFKAKSALDWILDDSDMSKRT
jgi:hypothetical protein